ncbi:RelA/SpoT family protein [Streptomyces clavuligerus]|nr:HD domain-containing protein [Streptomyces clavuligerus]ANW17724.1 kinase [Streptomyces clavuligerus]AXU12273.1 bifunctional (p)ppGpp synthetase/guanosine-3',5'-bis(diphosphate) 3'-pyrophosphohydrolase [Streptomyces clavuligerus]MBY6302151.1 bifunctional (p)ppGpp synthetase/guanosine-3',5'-bis(diphosphate) 3'-pyrophosphohydrolase [Streptomyces clavuligerus]QCS05054.1 bifunctional (p)ppGpp synthetase/guanosine-3',5'-bis(diphosphate) 3'-pyrophosphohydrolase [Streptomyces clavuligerus]QPJ95575
MSAEAANPGAHSRRRGRPRIDLRRLGRAALLGAPGRDRLPDAIAHMAEAHRGHHPDADLATLREAYLLAESSHRGQFRKSGEPYITHPLAVTLILAELGAETTTLTASLLHDTVEDTDVTLDQVTRAFGDEVAYLVDGVTKLEKVEYGAAAESETFRKMLVATGNDVRVMSIKLADRLHNMRTLGVMRPEKQARIARVTRDVLIPLAERLGVQAIKTELEDLAFSILHPAEYETTRRLIAENVSAGAALDEIAERVRAVLRDAGIAAEVLIRPRHFVSVHRVSIKRGELRGTDFGRLLVLVGEDADCYGVLGELHTCFTPVISEFKDFIAAPKFNLYQSLHTAVAGPEGSVAEVLIRTHRMHRVAEAGVIALGDPHVFPESAESADGDRADGERADGERVDPTRPGWLSRLLAWQESTPDSDAFWTSLRADLAQDREITVFGADGRVLGLPAGASCVDAAYAQYGERAHACIGARVNGRLATLSTVLSDGDTVHLLFAGEAPDASRAPLSGKPAAPDAPGAPRTSEDRGAAPEDADGGPSPDWLEHARTPAARIAITSWLETHPHGTEAPATAPRRSAPVSTETDRPAVADAVVDLPDATVRLAGCCTPVPPDPVIGFAVRGGVVTVHREECSAVARMAGPHREPIAARWGEAPGCRVTLVAESFGRPRLLADLTEVIAVAGAAIVSATVEPPSEQRVRHTYTLALPDAAGLPALMRAMRQVPGVYDVSRSQHPAATG